MGAIFQKSYTMPVPPGAEIIERRSRRIARWRLRNGELRNAEVVEGSGGDNRPLRVRGQSKYYSVRYRDAAGRMVERSTDCKDRVAARRILSELERRAELIRAGVLTNEEGLAAESAGRPLARNLDDYVRYLRAKGGNDRRITMLRRRIERVARDCRFAKLNKLSAAPVEEWLVERADAGMSPTTRNCYRESVVCFGNWCRRTRRLTCNPFEDLPRAVQNGDRRHQRRALTEQELLRLLKVARLRPLAEYGRDVAKKAGPKRSRRSRATWNREPLTFDDLDAAVARAREALNDNSDLIAELERTGRERELMYKTLVLTGLRKSELASLTVGQLDFTGPVAYAILDPADEKNRKGSTIPLRPDLAAELSTWLADRLVELQGHARRNGGATGFRRIGTRTDSFQGGSKRLGRRPGPGDWESVGPVPMRLPPSTPLFNVPTGLTRIFDRDLAVAGIPKRDERNRVVDVHALRVTFGTHLCAAGVPLRTAQAAMRHSKPELTANIYTDPKLLDVAGAIAALPDLQPDATGATAKSYRQI